MRRVLVAALALPLLVAGCGGNPEPKPLPKPPTSTSASPTPVAQPPVMPEEAKAKTKAGAIAFGRYYVDLVNYSIATGDTAALRSSYISLCTKCEAFSTTIDDTYKSGGRIDGGTWTVTSTKFYDIRNDVAVLDAFVDFADQTWIKSASAKPIRFKATTNNLKAFNLRWRGQAGWAVSALDPNK